MKDICEEYNLVFSESPQVFKNGLFYSKRVQEGYLRSSLEIFFYDEMKQRDVLFELERPYKNSKMKSDFYLPNLDIHIEIAGTIKNDKYSKKMKYKELQYDALIITPDKINIFLKRIDTHGFDKIKSYIRGII